MPKGHYIRPVRAIVRPIGPSIAYVPLTNELFALIDACDIPLVDGRNWCAHWAKNTETHYASTTVNSNGKRVCVEMQRMLLSLNPGMVADHKNGNTLDNRRSCNLRQATSRENRGNSRTRKDSKSGVKGVTPVSRNRWLVYALDGNKTRKIGVFSSLDIAAEVSANAAIKRYGEFARIS